MLWRGGGELASEFSWYDIEAKQGNALLKTIKLILNDLRNEYGPLFKQSQITNAKSLERLVEILSSFHLSSVNDDIKGMAFEHFIHSYTRGVKNDLGQYFTPRHIVRLIVQLINPQVGETIYDPFCGTGGMLIECFRYLSQRTSDPNDKIFLKSKTLYGKDISDVARIAMMNMIMFGDGHSNIERDDSFALLGETKQQYDIVITNIPFSQETEFYAGYPVMPSGLKNGNSIAVQHCLESLKRNETARAAIIVPIGFLYKPDLVSERKYIFNKWNLERVVELSPKCFQPYTETQTAILFIRRSSKVTSSYIYNTVKNDGFSQDGYRIPIPGENDLDKVIDGQADVEYPNDNKEPYNIKKIFYVGKSGNYLELHEVAKITAGTGKISPKTKLGDVNNGIYPIMMVADLAKRHIDYCLTESNYKITDQAVITKNPYLFPKYTTLIPTTGKASLKNHRSLLGINAYATSTLTGIETKEGGFHPYCLFYFFLTFDIEDITYDLGYPGISTTTLKNVLIPNYKVDQQNVIVEQISEAIEYQQALNDSHSNILKNNIHNELVLDK